jgi:hypothetical protein
LRGKDVRPGGQGIVQITGMQAETYRGQEKDMIVEAPECRFDTKANVASSGGALSIRTADGRFSIQGEGFQWQMGDSRQNSKLMISNQVQSLVRKRGMSVKAAGSGASSGAAGNATAMETSTNDWIRITSRQFEYQSDRATFRGEVRVEDPEGNLTAEVLIVVFRDESGVLERIEAGGARAGGHARDGGPGGLRFGRDRGADRVSRPRRLA